MWFGFDFALVSLWSHSASHTVLGVWVLIRMILSNFGLVACSKSCTVAPCCTCDAGDMADDLVSAFCCNLCCLGDLGI